MMIDQKLDELFDKLVPTSGKADTVAGELIRAITRIVYRYYNDGDKVGVGYGKETCNAPARYLMENTDIVIRQTVDKLWGLDDSNRYKSLLNVLEHRVLDFVESHPELQDKKNSEDMWDYSDPDEDSDTDDWDWA